MRSFDNMSISKKAAALTLFGGIGIFLLTGIAFIMGNLISLRRTQIESLSTLAQCLEAQAILSLDSNDHSGIEASLEALRSTPHILSAYIFSEEAGPIADYESGRTSSDHPERGSLADFGSTGSPAEIDKERHRFHSGRLSLWKPIIKDGQRLGTIWIQSDLSALSPGLRQNGILFCLLAAIIVPIALCAHARFQRLVCLPLLKLVEALQSVSRKKDYRSRLYADGNDEVNALREVFNRLLDEIQRRDEQIAQQKAKTIEQKDLLEKEIAQKAARLADRNRSLKRAVRRLRRAKQAAESANEIKSQFLAKMSHEIRTPMNGVLGMISLLLQTELTEKQRKFAGSVRASAEALLNIIDDILNFSKLEAGKIKLESLDFDLRTEIEEAVDLLAESACSKGLELVCALSPQLPSHVCGDPVRLRQIITNLVSNAIKFTERGEVVVAASLDKSVKDRAQLRFEVKDTGIGISPVVKEDIFRAFSQADGSTTRKYGGTGLGLTICKQLVEMMQGEIGVESDYGRGSTFWFTVRLALPSGAQAENEGLDRLKELNALIVDDNETNRNILRHQLTNWGVRTECARSAAEALSILLHAASEGRLHDVAILDMMMPDMDGLQLAQAIRSDPRTADVRLIMLTSVNFRDDSEEWTRAHISACLTKPVRQSQLLKALKSVGGTTGHAASKKDEEAATPLRKGLFSGRVLLAEDNPVNREVARTIIEDLGCLVDVAENGLEAIEAWSRRPYDLIFMDCQMPVIDGYEATNQIRQMERMGDGNASSREAPLRTPIVALTANVMEGDREKCLAAGMDEYLGKPFTQRDFQKILECWLMKGPLQASSDDGNDNGFDILELSTTDIHFEDEEGGIDANEPEPLRPSSLDSEVIEEIITLERGGSNGLLNRVVNIYLRDSENLMHSLRDAVAHADAPAMQKAAHTFKSSSANVGALALSSMSRELEAMGRRSLTEGAGSLLEQIEEEYARVRSDLKGLIESSHQGKPSEA